MVLLQSKPADYNPSLSIGKVKTQLTSFSYNDREVPLKLYFPETNKTANKAANRSPVILLSHGLGGSREVGAYLGTHWAGRGFVVGAMQHPGSDDSVWKKVPPSQRLKVMKTAANSANFSTESATFQPLSINSKSGLPTRRISCTDG